MGADGEDLEGEAERLARREIERTSPGEAALERLAARFGVPQGWYEEDDDWGTGGTSGGLAGAGPELARVAQTGADTMGFSELTMIEAPQRGSEIWLCIGASAIRADRIVALWATPEGKVVILLETGNRLTSSPAGGKTAVEAVAQYIEAMSGGIDGGSGARDGGREGS